MNQNLMAGEYAILVEQAPIMIWRAGTDKLCNYFNQRWLEFTGRTLEQEYGNGWVEGVHPDDMDHCMQIYITSFDRREIFEMEYRLQRRDGEYRWLLDRGVPFESAPGVFGGYIGSCIDITEQVKARELLLQARDREIDTLRGLLPICFSCKKVRDDKGYWEQLDVYVQQHSQTEFSHGICPDCIPKVFPDLGPEELESLLQRAQERQRKMMKAPLASD